MAQAAVEVKEIKVATIDGNKELSPGYKTRALFYKKFFTIFELYLYTKN